MAVREPEDDGAVVVPWAPGRVARVAPPRDVDVVLDELFGPPDEGGAGWFDIALLVAGVVLVVRGYAVFGAVLCVLGLALPARSAVRRLRRRARRRRYESMLTGGSPLATGSPVTAALVTAYDALLGVAEPLGPLGDEAVTAAHRAVVECASMLGGRTPATPEEAAYVARRTEAVRAAAAALAAAPAADRDERVAAVRAHEEIDALTGPTSLDDLRAVVRLAQRWR